MMLCGAFPMVYLIRKYCAKPLAVIGRKFGLSSDAIAGLLAGSANVLALLGMVKFLKAKDKVICIAFAVCCAFLFGDHLSFTANFQPNLIVVVLLGKLSAGICAIVFANLLAVKKAEELERQGLELGAPVESLRWSQRLFGNKDIAGSEHYLLRHMCFSVGFIGDFLPVAIHSLKVSVFVFWRRIQLAFKQLFA